MFGSMMAVPVQTEAETRKLREHG
ncbi:protein of unknown function [Azospirillum baldaniorum]|uniref:Uncharacterized protein n=1 Tax=Azospirillum baldaniorum TaxID=1064539 RepID=A0A9P1JPB9_9PROT|nr:protein of unknown function [Azospirillum baldaniorum]